MHCWQRHLGSWEEDCFNNKNIAKNDTLCLSKGTVIHLKKYEENGDLDISTYNLCSTQFFLEKARQEQAIMELSVAKSNCKIWALVTKPGTSQMLKPCTF